VAANIGVALDLWKDNRVRAAQRCTNSDQPEQALANMATIQGDRDLSAERLCALLPERQDQPALARSGGRISYRATIELPNELAADAAEFQLGLPSAGDCCRE
jgi:hypothetical protein